MNCPHCASSAMRGKWRTEATDDWDEQVYFGGSGRKSLPCNMERPRVGLPTHRAGLVRLPPDPAPCHSCSLRSYPQIGKNDRIDIHFSPNAESAA
jgi:hypothetical protein